MKTYLSLLSKILQEGEDRPDRTGVGTLSIFGHHMSFDLKEGFPLLTTKRLSVKMILCELLWFLSGQTNVQSLQDQGCHIWDPWADDHGDLGRVYGAQWRRWKNYEGKEFDQIKALIHGLKTEPQSRRHMVVAWNPGELSLMALPPCHCLFQFYVSRGELSCQLYQRSADIFLGVPYNIASYSFLTHMIAAQCGLKVGRFLWTGGDIHLYKNHVDQARLQLERLPRNLPHLTFKRTPPDIFSYVREDFILEGYDPYPHISAEIAV